MPKNYKGPRDPNLVDMPKVMPGPGGALRMVDKRGLPKESWTPALVDTAGNARRAARAAEREAYRGEGGIGPRSAGGRKVNPVYNTYP